MMKMGKVFDVNKSLDTLRSGILLRQYGILGSLVSVRLMKKISGRIVEGTKRG